MRFYFSDNCYYDSEESNVYRDGQIVAITPTQKRILNKLTSRNGELVSHEELYSYAWNATPIGDYKASISSQFTRKKESEMGLLYRVPELKQFYSSSRSQLAGGYRLSIPDDNIKGDQNENSVSKENSYWYTNSDFSSKARDAIEIDEYRVSRLMKTFLKGGKCTWQILFSNSDNQPVHRIVTDKIKETISNENNAIALTGAGGEGKTTVLMQLCAEFYKEGREVFYHAPTSRYDLPECSNDAVVFIDNPINSGEFKRLLSRLIDRGICVIFALRSNEWSILSESLFEDTKRSITEIPIQKLTINESRDFAKCIKYNIEELTWDEETIERVFYKDSYGFLYASMLMAIYESNSLEDIAYQILAKINEHEQGKKCLNVLAAVVYAEKCGIDVNYKLYRYICYKADIDEQLPHYYLKMELSRNGAFYQTRHSTISFLYFRYLFRVGDWKSFLDIDIKEQIADDLLSYALKAVETTDKDLSKGDFRAVSISQIACLAIETFAYDEDFVNYIIQRTFESCKEHGYSAIYMLFRGLNNERLRIKLIEKCFEARLNTWTLYSYWIDALVDEQKVDEASEIFKILFEMEEFPLSMFYKWASTEENNNNIGDFETRNTAAWIYKTILELDPNKASHHANMAEFLMRHPDLKFNLSIDELLKKACIEFDGTEREWIIWGKYKESISDFGGYEKIGSAAWIYKELCEVRNLPSSGEGWIRWADLVDKYPALFEGETKDSVLERACLIYDADSSVWHIWASEKIKNGVIGNYTVPNSAAWIYREVCTKHNPTGDSVVWLKWISLVELYPETLSDITPLEIVRMACLDYNITYSQLWSIWADKEAENGNIGDYSIPNSAAWIYREAAERENDDNSSIWLAWSRFADKYSDILSCKKEYNGLKLLEKVCLDGNADSYLWMEWAKQTENKGRIGDYTSEYTAAWIYREYCVNRNFKRNPYALLYWALFANEHPMYYYNELIDANYVLEYARANYSIFHDESWEALQELKKKIE